jgi:hypothetical protein
MEKEGFLTCIPRYFLFSFDLLSEVSYSEPTYEYIKLFVLIKRLHAAALLGKIIIASQ